MVKLDHESRNAVSERPAKIVKEMSEGFVIATPLCRRKTGMLLPRVKTATERRRYNTE